MKLIVGLCFLIVIYGCAPTPYTYYEPIAQGGKLSNAIPGALVAPHDMVEFSFDDVKIRLQGGGTGVYIVISIPEGRSACFVSDELEWFESNTATRTKVKFNLTYYDSKAGEVVSSKPTDVMIRNNRDDSLAGPKSGIYENYIKFSETQRNCYSVKLSGINVDGEMHEIPIIEFVKKEGYGLFPVNN